MVSDDTLPLGPNDEVRPPLVDTFSSVRLGTLVTIFVCAALGTVVGNAIYDFSVKSWSEESVSSEVRPSGIYLSVTKSPPVDFATVEQASEDFYANVAFASVPSLLSKADECWATYDAAPQWKTFDYCVGFDMLLRSHASPSQIEAHANTSRYVSITDRRTERFLLAQSEPLGGELVIPQRVTSIAATIPIDSF